MASSRIKKGDDVIVISGGNKKKDHKFKKGDKGKVLRVLPETNQVIVEGLNLIKRHQSPQKYAQAGIVEIEAPINLSNVMLADPESGKPTRVGFEIKDGKKVRIAKKSGAVID